MIIDGPLPERRRPVLHAALLSEGTRVRITKPDRFGHLKSRVGDLATVNIVDNTMEFPYQLVLDEDEMDAEFGKDEEDNPYRDRDWFAHDGVVSVRDAEPLAAHRQRAVPKPGIRTGVTFIIDSDASVLVLSQEKGDEMTNPPHRRLIAKYLGISVEDAALLRPNQEKHFIGGSVTGDRQVRWKSGQSQLGPGRKDEYNKVINGCKQRSKEQAAEFIKLSFEKDKDLFQNLTSEEFWHEAPSLKAISREIRHIAETNWEALMSSEMKVIQLACHHDIQNMAGARNAALFARDTREQSARSLAWQTAQTGSSLNFGGYAHRSMPR